MAEVGLSPAAAASPQSLATWLEGWLVDVAASRAASTHDSYSRAVRSHITPHLGSVKIEKLGPAHVRRWLTALADTPSRARQNAFKVLRLAMNDAKRLQIITSNPTDQFEAPKHQRKPIEPFTAAEASKICKALAGTEWGLFVAIGFGCGLRQGEILGLQWGDLAGNDLKISRQQVESGGTIRVTEPKSESGRRVVPVPSMVEEGWVAARAIALKAGRAKAGDPVFVGPNGGRLRRSNFRSRWWKPTLARLDVPYRSPHQMRHTYATLALQAGVPVTVVSRILGHSKTSITLDVYSHAAEDGIEAARRFSEGMFRDHMAQ